MVNAIAGLQHRAAYEPHQVISTDQNRQMIVHGTYADPHADPTLDFAASPIEAITLGHVRQPSMLTLQQALHPLLARGQAALPEHIEPGRAYRMRPRPQDPQQTTVMTTLASRQSDLPALRGLEHQKVELPKAMYEQLPPEKRALCNTVFDGQKAYVPAKDFFRHIKGQDGSSIQVDLPSGASQSAVGELSHALLVHARQSAPDGLYTHVKAQSAAMVKFMATQERPSQVRTVQRRDAQGQDLPNQVQTIPASAAYTGSDMTRMHYYFDDHDRTAIGFLTQHNS